MVLQLKFRKIRISKKKINGIREMISGPTACFYVFCSFIGIAFFTGGGSRDDIQSLVVLRPLAILFCAFSLTIKEPGQWKGRLAPLYILSCLALLMALQLVPLPPAIWTELSGRQIFADIADTAGITQPWRPLTLSPSETLNSLFSLVVPAAATMLYLNLNQDFRKRVVPVIIIFCLVSAFWGILQIAGPSRGPLYLYRITNFSAGVGLFANRNHQAIVLVSSIVMLGWYVASLRRDSIYSSPKFYASVAGVLLIVPMVSILGSRAGLLLTLPAIIMVMVFLFLSRQSTANSDHAIPKRHSLNLFARRAIISFSVLGIAGVTVLSLFFSRSLALDRLLGTSEVDELRFHLFPTFLTMLENYLPWGSGFGTFEHTYKIYEVQDLLSPKYLNQAHSDWVQFALEGGLPAIFIAIGALIWVLTRLVAFFRYRSASKTMTNQALMCMSVLLILLFASLFDYPLRVPSIMAVFVIFACIFNDTIRVLQRRGQLYHLA